MPINFTNSPTVGNTVSAGNVTWTWNGSSWSAGLSQNAITLVANTAPIGASTTGGTATISLLVSGVTAGTYGNATIIPVITVDTYGRITSASNVATAAGFTTGKAIAMAIVFGG